MVLWAAIREGEKNDCLVENTPTQPAPDESWRSSELSWIIPQRQAFFGLGLSKKHIEKGEKRKKERKKKLATEMGWSWHGYCGDHFYHHFSVGLM